MSAHRIVFLGGDRVSAIALSALHARFTANHLRRGGAIAVIAPPLSAGGHPNPIHDICKRHHEDLALHVINHPASLREMPPPAFLCRESDGVLQSQWDAAVVVSCRYFLTKAWLAALPRTINL